MNGNDIFRIYQCRRCKNTGFAHVQTVEAESRCTLCNGPILHEKSSQYASTLEEAKQLLAELVLSTRLDTKGVGSSRGLGVKRRILNIVEAIIDTNRGHPAKWHQIMSECSDAGIESERVSHFIDVLKREGALTEQGGGLVLNGEGVMI
ncbi:MAG: hypothetical protein ACFFF4_15505 [Candidatus Thorarchaeota archaeon]